MAVQGIDLVSDTTVKELVEQIKYGNALRAAEAADSLATLKGDFKGIQSLVRNGLASKVFEPGDQIVVPWTDKDSGKQYQVPMDIVHFGDVTLKDSEVVPGMYLQWHYATPYGVMFDAHEALYYAAEELPAGAYTFNIPSAWSKAEAGDYTFTLTQEKWKERKRLQEEAARDCNNLLALMQIAKTLFHLETRRVKHWGKKTIEVRNRIRDWKDGDSRRYNKLLK